MSNYYKAVDACLNRYWEMVHDELDSIRCWGGDQKRYSKLKNLKDFISQTGLECIGEQLPLNKLNRWLGYVQGVLIALDVTDVETERNWTRPLFRPLDLPLL